MDNVEQLFIRACKSGKDEGRIFSVYRRFYGRHPKPEIEVARILSDISTKYLTPDIRELLFDMSPDRKWHFNISENDCHYMSIIKVLSSKIKLTKSSCFTGLTVPSSIRNNN